MTLTFRERKLDSLLTLLLLIAAAMAVFCMPFLYHGRADLLSNDEKTLLAEYPAADTCQILSSSLDSKQAYVCSAYILRGIGATASDGPLYGAVLSAALTLIPLLKFRRIPMSVFMVACAWGAIRAIFLSVLSKDLISSFVILAAMLLGGGRFFGGTWFVSATIYGWVVRKYWIIVACLWFALCRIRKWLNIWTIVLGLFVFYLALAFLLGHFMGQPLQFARQTMNDAREVGAYGAQTIIQPILVSNNPFIAAADAVLTFFRLVLPVELLKTPGIQKIGFLLIMPVTALWMFRLILDGVNSKVPEMIAAGKVALAPFAFLVVEAVFEPDFGSFARHFAMVSPLVFYGMALANRKKFSGLSESRNYFRDAPPVVE